MDPRIGCCIDVGWSMKFIPTIRCPALSRASRIGEASWQAWGTQDAAEVVGGRSPTGVGAIN
jgi:hypothetical protein